MENPSSDEKGEKDWKCNIPLTFGFLTTYSRWAGWVESHHHSAISALMFRRMRLCGLSLIASHCMRHTHTHTRNTLTDHSTSPCHHVIPTAVRRWTGSPNNMFARYNKTVKEENMLQWKPLSKDREPRPKVERQEKVLEKHKRLQWQKLHTDKVGLVGRSQEPRLNTLHQR